MKPTSKTFQPWPPRSSKKLRTQMSSPIEKVKRKKRQESTKIQALLKPKMNIMSRQSRKSEERALQAC